MKKSVYKVKGGKLIKVQLSERDGKIEKIKITGDFFLHPEDFIEDVEKTLIGKPLEESYLADFIKELMNKKRVILLGASPTDLAKCITMAGEEDV